MAKTDKSIGIIGFGNMGSVIYEKLKDSYPLLVFDKDLNKTAKLTGATLVKNLTDLLNKSNVVILAVKPQDFDNLMASIVNDVTKEQLFVSIAAGITTEYVQNRLSEVRVVRVMPNMPAKIGKGMSCLCKGEFATKEDLIFAKHLFDKLGETLLLQEDMMDGATAISGSGPGYYFDIVDSKQEEFRVDPQKVLKDFVRSLTEAAESIGVSHNDAVLLANVTGVGSHILLKQSKLPAAELKNQVASKGGTTEAALDVLHKSGSLIDAVKAALERARELSRR